MTNPDKVYPSNYRSAGKKVTDHDIERGKAVMRQGSYKKISTKFINDALRIEPIKSDKPESFIPNITEFLDQHGKATSYVCKRHVDHQAFIQSAYYCFMAVIVRTEHVYMKTVTLKPPQGKSYKKEVPAKRDHKGAYPVTIGYLENK